HHRRLDRLSSLGVIPGNRIKLHQKKPSFIIQIDETNIALESSIAAEIFVQNG
ncbi:MAG TPA: ferrous iron transport protein A, partial [Bacteroidetes bacterium]|nr:ferrous iron transport protein A [Bacteroidota bacterium]